MPVQESQKDSGAEVAGEKMDTKSAEGNFAQGVAASKTAGKVRAGATTDTTSSPMQTTAHALQEDPGRVAAAIQYNQWVKK